jgi:hypothetical protein
MTKYGLLIGIKYEKSKLKLKGTDNDIDSIQSLLLKWGFAASNITIIKNEKATSYALNTALNKFLSNLKADDQAVVFYSGHGILFKNRLGNQESSLVPVDYKKGGVITSETIRYYLNKVSPGANVLCIFDACNSGTICDLKYHVFDTSFKKDVTKKIKKYDSNEWILRQVHCIPESKTGTGDIETPANIITISGCWDDQVSYDLHKNGALTMSILSVINFYGIEKLTLEKFLQYLRGSLLYLRLNQTPQLTLGNYIDVSTNIKSFLKIEK